MGATLSDLEYCKEVSNWGEAESLILPGKRGVTDLPRVALSPPLKFKRNPQLRYLDALNIEWTPAYLKYGALK